MEILVLTTGWIVTVFIGLLEGLVLYKILDGTIKLDKLISESNGDASLSRFQFLIFTFVIAMSLFFVIVSQNPIAFPSEIPAGIFSLLGISGGTYVISKGIQKSRDADPNISKFEADKAKVKAAAAKAKASETKDQ